MLLQNKAFQYNMQDKYKNKYRIKSHRMPGWYYSNNGMYFLTIVTQNRICNLGEIINAKMVLSDFGQIVKNEFEKSFEIRDELFLNEYIIMPNHIHMIIVLDDDDIIDGDIGDDNIDNIDGDDGNIGNIGDDDENGNENDDGDDDGDVQTHGRASLRIKIPRQPKSISSFFAGFKSATNTKIDDYIDENNLDIPKYNKKNHFFQPNYHDHIIRNNNEYNRISEYIKNNPQKWNDDTFNDTKNE